MFIVRVKYTKCAMPTETEFNSLNDAELFADKKRVNPYVRWIKIDTKRDYPNKIDNDEIKGR